MSTWAHNIELGTLVWKYVCIHLLEWTDSEAAIWAKQYEDERKNPDSLFYHESTLYYITPWLIPKSLTKCLQYHELYAIAWRLECAIMGASYPFDRLDMPYPFSTKQDIVNFNWSAACERVDSVLREYGTTLEQTRREQRSK